MKKSIDGQIVDLLQEWHVKMRQYREAQTKADILADEARELQQRIDELKQEKGK